MSIPIIYVFRGWQPYFDLSVRQAKKFNPNSPIYHVTSEDSKIAEGAIAVFDKDYIKGARRFQESYQHMSVNSHSFELFCFQRWMISYELMVALDIQQAVLMDGDVLLWTDVSKVCKDFEQFGISWTEPDQPGSVFVSNRETLKALCDHIFKHYETEEGLNRLKAEYNQRIADGRPAAITDMSLLTYFRQDFPGVVGDMGQIVQGGRFDHAMFESDGYVMDCGLKKFNWKGGLPYGTQTDTGKEVKFFSMHFVGKSKGYMDLYASGKNLTRLGQVMAFPAFLRARIPAAIRKIKGKLGVKGKI